jgi:hypothetical protein
MRKALATFGTGPSAPLLRLALPTFTNYAEQHGYEVIVGTGESDGRPAAWGKIPLLQRLLTSYDFVLWIDADALILDTSVDIETLIPADAFQAYVVETSWPGWGDSPCTGVWALRASERTQSFLAAVWEQTDFTNHKWWEQAAVMHLTGWRIELPMCKERESEWDDGTFILPGEWDVVPVLPAGYAPSRIRHHAGWPSYRRRAFDMRTDLAGPRSLRRWVGLQERRLRPLYWPVKGFVGHRVRQLRGLIRR